MQTDEILLIEIIILVLKSLVEYVCIYRQNLALNDLQGLICHKTQTTNQQAQANIMMILSKAMVSSPDGDMVFFKIVTEVFPGDSLGLHFFYNLSWLVSLNIHLPNTREWYHIVNCNRKCPWCNGYRRRKWARRHEFKSWTTLIAFSQSINTLGKGMNPITLTPAMGK